MRFSPAKARRSSEGGPPHMPEALGESVLKGRVRSGVVLIAGWGSANLLVGFFGNLVLARLLLPRDFGIVAIGATLMMFTTALADGGLGSGLIRRAEAPDRRELRAALALQLALTSTLAASAALVASFYGRAGLVVALMMIALPIAALPTPGRIVLSRALRFRALATVEGTGTLCYYAWAVGGVVAGFGVWALASAVVVRAAVAAVGVAMVSGLGVVLPSHHGVRALRPVISFGVRFQAVSLAGTGREQGLNAGVAAISGVSTLGIWTLTKRLLEFPALMFEPLHRVSFPYLSHLLAAGKDPSRLLERGVALAAAASGLVLVTTAAAAPEIVPALFGEQWRPVAPILQLVCAALFVAGPISVAAVGYLYALGRPSVVLRATVLHTATLFVVAFSLLPVLGSPAIGMGSLAGAVVDALLLGRALGATTQARPLRILAPILGIGLAAAAAGLAVTSAAGPGVVAGLAGAVTAAVTYGVLLAAIRRDVALDAVSQIRAAARKGFARERPEAPEEGAYPVEVRPASAS